MCTLMIQLQKTALLRVARPGINIHLCRVAVFRKSTGDSARSRSVQLLLVAAEADHFVVVAPSRVDSRLKTRWTKPTPEMESL